MAFAVDLNKKTIRASIGDLVALEHGHQHGLGLLGRARAELGTKVHQQYRERNEARDPQFEAEVSVSMELGVDGFKARVQGRLDGLFRSGTGLVVEEVKSVAMGGAELARSRTQFFPDFTLQLRLYALALALAEPEVQVSARLVLVSLLDQTQRVMEVEPHPQNTRARLEDLLRAAIEQERQNQARKQRLTELAEKISFPYPQMRPHQKELVETMEQGLRDRSPVLAMAPTGIGKTVAALLAGLRFSLAHDSPLLFLTAKTTQQHLVEQTFEDMWRAAELRPGELRCLTVRAKEKMCPPGHLLCHPNVCPLLKDFESRLLRSDAIKQLLQDVSLVSPDSIMACGESHSLCPYQLSSALMSKMDLLIGDYNYAYDPGVVLTQLFENEQRNPATVIVDEAHNLFDRARDYYSPFIGRNELRALQTEISSGSFLSEGDRTDQLNFDELLTTVDGPALFNDLFRLLGDVDQAINLNSQTAESSGNHPVEDCRPSNDDDGAFHALGQRAESQLIPYVLYNRTHGLVRPRDPLIDLLARLVRLREVLAIRSQAFIPYSAGQQAPQGAGFGCLCVNPASPLAQRHQAASGTLAMSATLTPLSYYTDVLGFGAHDPQVVSMPSPFPRENLGVWTVPGIDTTYRQREKHIPAIAQAIVQTTQARPGRYVVFFPSFKFLSSVQAQLGSLPGQTLIQLPGMNDLARKRLLDRLRTSSGPCLLMGVMGGIFAEGVDLPGDELIGALIVGPGLPQIGFERAAMQHYFQQEYEAGFAYSMLYPGMQRVIQSAGRVIRTPEDQGVIVLLGRRFSEPDLASCLPEHWYRYRPSELATSDLTASLEEFWAS